MRIPVICFHINNFDAKKTFERKRRRSLSFVCAYVLSVKYTFKTSILCTSTPLCISFLYYFCKTGWSNEQLFTLHSGGAFLSFIYLPISSLYVHTLISWRNFIFFRVSLYYIKGSRIWTYRGIVPKVKKTIKVWARESYSQIFPFRVEVILLSLTLSFF